MLKAQSGDKKEEIQDDASNQQTLNLIMQLISNNV